MVNISEGSLHLLTSSFTERFYRRGSILIAEGDHNDFVYFLRSGFSRAYVTKSDREITLWFASAGDATGAYQGRLSAVNIEILEDSYVLVISRKRLEHLLCRNIELANFKEHPEVLKKASVKQIASYLGIAPQSPSRIRRYRFK